MNATVKWRQAVVLCDNDLLFRAIECNLEKRLKIKVVAPHFEPLDRYGEGIVYGADLNLIVVALSAPAGEPVVELVHRSLVGHLGKTPLLIISDRPFDSSPRDRIAYLSFPFSPDELCAQVEELLQHDEET